MRSFRFCKTTVVALLLASALSLPAQAAPRGVDVLGLWARFTAWVGAVLAPAPRAEKDGGVSDPLGTPSAAGEDCANEACLNFGPHLDPLG